MQLYDMESPVDWFYTGMQTYDEMKVDPERRKLTEVPCVLYDNGQGKVYGFETLQDATMRMAVPYTGSLKEDFENLMDAIIGTYKAPGVAEAQATADEAKQIAESAGTDPAIASFVTLSLPSVAPTAKDSAIAPVLKYSPEYVENGHEYKKGEVFVYTDGTYWRVSQDFTSQSQWKPGDSGLTALFYQIELAPDGIIVWAQPRGEFDAPDAGDLRHYPNADGPVYRSKVDDNACSPDVRPDDWELVEDDGE